MEYGDDLCGTDILTRCGSSCSIRHCAPVVLSKKEATERIQYIKENGYIEYIVRYVRKIQKDELEKAEIVREYKRNFYKEWGFDSNMKEYLPEDLWKYERK